MLEVARLPALPRAIPTPVAVVAGVVLSVALGAAIGNPTPLALMLFLATAGAAALAWIAARPFVGYMIIAGSAFMLVVIPVSQTRNANAFDVVLPVILVVAWLGGGVREAREGDALETGPAHDAILGAQRKFSRAAEIYFGLAALSLVPMAFRIGVVEALDRVLHLWRGLQGALLFPLGLWLLRSDQRIRHVYHAVLGATALFTVVNAVQLLTGVARRAGPTWYPTHPEWPVESANAAGASLVVVVALILAHHAARPRFSNYVLLAIVLFMLFLTQSRSGLLALVIFAAFSLRRVRWRDVIGAGLVFGIALAAAPPYFWNRIVRSLAMEKGTFELYSFLVRVYSYQTAWKAFLDHWFFGVGYLGYQYVNTSYNLLRAQLMTTENMWLETAVGMGVVGLIALNYWFVRLFTLGRAVRRATPPGSLGHEMGRIHAPLMAGLTAANLTGTNFVGLMGIGVVALWCALLIRAGHLAVEAAPSKRTLD